MSVKRDFRPSLPLVNWKDEQDNFYLIDLPRDEVPTVVKFRLVEGGVGCNGRSSINLLF